MKTLNAKKILRIEKITAESCQLKHAVWTKHYARHEARCWMLYVKGIVVRPQRFRSEVTGSRALVADALVGPIERKYVEYFSYVELKIVNACFH